MMKVKVDQIIFFIILLHVLSTQSVLMFKFFELFGIWETKSLLHPITLILLISAFVLKISSLKVKSEDLIVFVYLLFLLVMIFININSFFSLYLSLREVFFLFILIFLLNQFSFSENQYLILSKLLVVSIVVGLILTILTYIMGPEKFMTMLVGHYTWGKDELTNFKISIFMSKFWRSPGAVGSSGGTAYFALCAYYFFDLRPNQKLLKLFAAVLLISTFTRSAILCLTIYELLKFLNNKKNLVLIYKYSFVIVGFLIITIALLARTSVLSLESTIIRVEIWLSQINVEYNLLFGGQIGKVGGAVRGEGPEAVLDSYWLFLLYSTGILGIIIWFFFIFQKAKISKRKCFFIVGIIFSGFFIHLTQSITFLVMFPLIFANYNAIRLSNITKRNENLVE